MYLLPLFEVFFEFIDNYTLFIYYVTFFLFFKIIDRMTKRQEFFKNIFTPVVRTSLLLCPNAKQKNVNSVNSWALRCVPNF